MKKLIARHKVSMYQICRCFRNGEQEGRMHNPEFTMLEYYIMDAGYLDSLSLTEALFTHLLDAQALNAVLPPGAQSRMRPPFLRITVEEAFRRWAGFSLEEAAAKGRDFLEAQGRRLGLDPPGGLDAAALYDLIFVHAVESELPGDRPVVLMDYPAFVPCLARKKAGTACRERWELYVNGIELANCYSEETDPENVRDFFLDEAAKKEGSALVHHTVDPDYYRIFSPPGDAFPRCSGTAMGIDRLIMALTGSSCISQVTPFSG
jgi:lysyl-tRNA synthetase class 2